MLKELNLDELIAIEGGTDPCYDSGHAVGKAISAGIAAYGIYCLFMLL